MSHASSPPTGPGRPRRTVTVLGRAAPPVLAVGAALLLAGCGFGGTTTVVQAPPTTVQPPTTDVPPPPTYTPPTTYTPPPTTTTPSGPSAAERRRTRRINALKRAAERETRKFFTAVRTRDTQGVCSRLTTAQVGKLGGRASCGNGRFVKEAAVRQVPPSNGSLRFTVVLTTNNTRATALIRHPVRRYIVRLARQGGSWRINGFSKLS